MKRLLWLKIILTAVFLIISIQSVYARRTASIARIARDENSEEVEWNGRVTLQEIIDCDIQDLLDMAAQCRECINLTVQGQCPDCCLIADPVNDLEKQFKCTSAHNNRFACGVMPFTCTEIDMTEADWEIFNNCSHLDGAGDPPVQTPLGPVDGAQPRGCPQTNPDPNTSDNDNARCEEFNGFWYCTDPDIFPHFAGCRPEPNINFSHPYKERFFKDAASIPDDYYEEPTVVITGAENCPASFAQSGPGPEDTDKKLASLLMIPAGDPDCSLCTDDPCTQANRHCLVKDDQKKCVKLNDIDDEIAKGWFDCDDPGGEPPDPPDPPDPEPPVTCYKYEVDSDFGNYANDCRAYTMDLERCLQEVSCCEANICCPSIWPDGTPKECSGPGFSFQENCSTTSCNRRSLDQVQTGPWNWDDEIGTLHDFQTPTPEHYCCGRLGRGRNSVDGSVATCATNSLDSGFCAQIQILADRCLAGQPSDWDCTSCYREIDQSFFYEFVPKSGESFAIFWEINSEDPGIGLPANQAYFFTRVILYGLNPAGQEVPIVKHSSMLHQRDFTNAFNIFAGTNIDAGSLVPGKTYRLRLEYFIPDVSGFDLTMDVLNMHLYVTRTRE